MASKSALTILYVTDNSLPESFDVRVRELLVKAANGYPIVSVSQKPVSLGTNVCVGGIGRNWHSIYKQMQAGLEKIDTPYIAIVEHDCLYVPEHFEFTPPTDEFWYNKNCWLLQYYGQKAEGMFSYWPKRMAQSQVITTKKALEAHVNETEEILAKAYAAPTDKGRRAIQHELNAKITPSNYRAFQTANPNIDIRHAGNYTGPRRGKMRMFSLPYWGTIKDIFPC